MNRSIVYLTNEHPFYLRMVFHSLEMLVPRISVRIPIRVYLVRDRSRQTIERSGVSRPFDGYSASHEMLDSIRDLGVEVRELEPLFTLEEGFFHAQRMWFDEIKEESLLYIDADTFIFGDVNELFDAYPPDRYDFVAAEAEWVKGRDFPRVFDPELRPFSSGVMLWNNRKHWDWATELQRWMWAFRTRRHPLSEWLYDQHPDCLLREEFAATAWVDSRLPDIRYGYFQPEEVQLIRYVSDFDRLGQQIIFHSYTPNWKTVRSLLDGHKKKIPALRTKNGPARVSP